jgi:K+-transporting ATPase KdpF subunit
VTVDTLVWIAGLVAGALLVYLVIALLLPEKLQ